MQSTAILRGIIDIQSEEIARLMSLVEHLTGCLEQSQSGQKAALQRCSELEIATASQVSVASWRTVESFPAASASSAAAVAALDTPDTKERSDTLVFVVFLISSSST